METRAEVLAFTTAPLCGATATDPPSRDSPMIRRTSYLPSGRTSYLPSGGTLSPAFTTAPLCGATATDRPSRDSPMIRRTSYLPSGAPLHNGPRREPPAFTTAPLCGADAEDVRAPGRALDQVPGPGGAPRAGMSGSCRARRPDAKQRTACRRPIAAVMRDGGAGKYGAGGARPIGVPTDAFYKSVPELLWVFHLCLSVPICVWRFPFPFSSVGSFSSVSISADLCLRFSWCPACAFAVLRALRALRGSPFCSLANPRRSPGRTFICGSIVPPDYETNPFCRNSSSVGGMRPKIQSTALAWPHNPLTLCVVPQNALEVGSWDWRAPNQWKGGDFCHRAR